MGSGLAAMVSVVGRLSVRKVGIAGVIVSLAVVMVARSERAHGTAGAWTVIEIARNDNRVGSQR